MAIARDPLYMVICGVGGQGNILISRLLGRVLLKRGYNITVVDTFGVAQRGGAVSSHVRFGKKVYSPIITMGEADYLVMMEKMESLRWLNYANQSTIILVDDIEITPPIVNIGEMEYPGDIEQNLRNHFKEVHMISATSIASELGNDRAANVVLLGAFSTFLDITEKQWLTCLLTRLPERLHELNTRAFAAGKKAL